MSLSRRRFLTISGGVAVSAMAPGRAWCAAEDTVRLGIIGMGTRGNALLRAFSDVPGVRIAAVCDPDRERVSAVAEKARAANADQEVIQATDFRRILERDDIDAVAITMPNHWHALATVWACEAGKHIYVEKPIAHSLWESRQMVNAAAKYKRIVQAGLQRSSDGIMAQLYERIRSGEFGKILRARAMVYGVRGDIGRRDTPIEIPDFVDYNLWAGPAEMRPLYRRSFHYDWHWMWETGNGELGNNGPHFLDLVLRVLGHKTLAPVVASVGGRFVWDDVGETPNAQVLYYGYEPAPLFVDVRNLPSKAGGSDSDTFRGQESSIVIECENAYFIGLSEGELRDNDHKVIETIKGDGGAGHQRNFIDALRAQDASVLNCPIADAHPGCGLTLEGNISHRIGSPGTPKPRTGVAGELLDALAAHLEANEVDLAKTPLTVGPVLHWDDATERFSGEHADAANKLLRRESYREPFVLHEVA